MVEKQTPCAPDGPALLTRIAGPNPPPFAVLCRSTAGQRQVDVLVGEMVTAAALADLHAGTAPGDGGILALVPYRQITERGFECHDDGTPLLFLRVARRATMSISAALERLPSDTVRSIDGGFDVADDDYSEIVRRVVGDEIGSGQGSNFVIRRSYSATIADFSVRSALAMFRALVERESGTYWTFLVHTGDRVLLGASPERHVSMAGGTVLMNPISGTYRYPPTGPDLGDLLDFLADQKETDELYMVLDEELKMMTRVCDRQVRVIGPRLKEMAKLAHTEYDIEGGSSLDPAAVLRETMFAPTVTGSPVENAVRVIKRQESSGRGYYSGVVAYLSRDAAGAPLLDSAIMIRTADIDSAGRMDIGVGSTLVRHSDPAAEVAETRTKVAGLLGALRAERPVAEQPARPAARFGADAAVRAALARRNTKLARFWLDLPEVDTHRVPHARVLMVDAEDTFTAMLSHQLRSFGLDVTVRPYAAVGDLPGEHDLVVLGPGPGDPNADADPKMATLAALAGRLLERRVPTLAVCLSHQVLCRNLGLRIVRRVEPNQGTQRELDLFGRRATVGFYNTFVAVSGVDELAGPHGRVQVSRDRATGEVYATRGTAFRSLQFHPESILSEHGMSVLVEQLRSLLAAPAGT